VVLRYRARAAARRGEGGSSAAAWSRQRLALVGGEDRLVPLQYFPGGLQNPYLRLLYSRLPETGFVAGPLGHYEALEDAPGRSVFHLHWTRVFQVGVGSEREAERQTARYLERIERFLGRGGRLVWSIHEALPHDCEYPAVEVAARRRLVEMAAGVHVLHEGTVAEVADRYALDPAKTFVVEHPLYDGAYPDYVTREAARMLLGLAPDDVLLLGFGAIRPYKGFDRLIAMVPRLRRETGLAVRVTVAGPTFKSVDVAPLRAAATAADGVAIATEAIPDEHVQVLFRAADVAVLPYRRVLNSGVLMLALTFGTPAVAPENAVTREAASSGLVHLFEASSDDDLARAVLEAVGRRHRRGELPADFRARYDPTSIAGEFARQLQHRLLTEPGGPARKDSAAS
jgi:glycosyltransferase involved in cell wall biosynthesis